MSEQLIKFGDVYQPKERPPGYQFAYLITSLRDAASNSFEHAAVTFDKERYHLLHITPGTADISDILKKLTTTPLTVDEMLDIFVEKGYKRKWLRPVFEAEARKPPKKFSDQTHPRHFSHCAGDGCTATICGNRPVRLFASFKTGPPFAGPSVIPCANPISGSRWGSSVGDRRNIWV